MKRKIHFRENWLIFLGIWGEAGLFFRDLGSKGKILILLGSRGNYFQGSGEINALFSGIKGAQTPLGPSLCPWRPGQSLFRPPWTKRDDREAT